MLQYVTNCGQDGYSAPTDVFLDHHLAVVLNRKYRLSIKINASSGQENHKENRNYEGYSNEETILEFHKRPVKRDGVNESDLYDFKVALQRMASGLLRDHISYLPLSSMCEGILSLNSVMFYSFG
jgi:hypothetical protein